VPWVPSIPAVNQGTTSKRLTVADPLTIGAIGHFVKRRLDMSFGWLGR
jgi:hypothetical protein